ARGRAEPVHPGPARLRPDREGRKSDGGSDPTAAQTRRSGPPTALWRPGPHRAMASAEGLRIGSRLSGKVAVITGSSRGIGLAVARAFLSEGAQVVVNSRDPERAEAVAAKLGENATGIAADVATASGAVA